MKAAKNSAEIALGNLYIPLSLIDFTSLCNPLRENRNQH